ncbi:hypothetical protein BH23GEM10_BH23GEM10_06560 [soil metagenome]
MTKSTRESDSAGPRQPAPPALTRPGRSGRARAVSVFAPPFAAGRTLSRTAAPSAIDVEETGSPAPAPAPVESDDEIWVIEDEGQEQGAAVPAWDTHETLPEDKPVAFPLDAFIVPADSQSVPNGWTDERTSAFAGNIADRLETLADSVRTGGVNALIDATDADELSQSIARVVADFYQRGLT